LDHEAVDPCRGQHCQKGVL